MRKYHQSIPLPSVLTGSEEKRSMVGNYLAANVAQRSGDNLDAIKNYEAALLQDPENGDIVHRLYSLYLFNGMYDQAIVHAKRQYELDIKNKVPLKDRNDVAYLLISLEKFKQGKTKDIPAIMEQIRDPKVQPRSHLDGIVMPMVLIWSYVVEQDFTSAFRVIDSITSQYMLSVFSYNRAIINDIANNKPVKVGGKELTLHGKAQKLLSEVFFEMGQYSLQSGSVDEGIIYLRLARYLEPNSTKLKKVLALSYEGIGRFKEAIEVYHEIPQSSPSYGEVQISIALAYHRLDQNEKAIEILEALKQNEKYHYQALLGLGSIMMSQAKYDEAIKYFEQAELTVTQPTKDHWNLFFNIGVAYDKADKWERSEGYLKKAVELFPQNPESLNYLAYSWLVRNKNIKQARAMLESAVIRSGGAPHILDSYGWALYKLGYYKEAIPFLEQASNSMAYSTVISDHLGDAYWKVGRKREARFQWQKALDVFERDQDITPEITREQLQDKLDNGLEG